MEIDLAGLCSYHIDILIIDWKVFNLSVFTGFQLWFIECFKLRDCKILSQKCMTWSPIYR
jgi:hypothetical protein